MINKSLNNFILTIAALIFVSCVTTIEFGVEHPPLVDMRNMETITVIPVEWKNNGSYDYLANNLTRILATGIKRIKAYTFVEPSVLIDIGESGYWEYFDVYIDCEIINVTAHDKTEIKEEKNGDETKTKEYVTRTVTVDIVYKYIRAIDGGILGNFNKTAQSSYTFDDSARSSKWWVELLLNIFLPKGPSEEKLAKSAIQKFSYGMRNELIPYMAKEKREILESTNKNPAFKEARKLVRQKKYFEALIIYKDLYKQTGSFIAGYNTALMLEANNQFTEALVLLEELDEKILKNGINSPPFIKTEIEKLKSIINELTILEEYKN
jgi:hypothetical protein